MNRLSLLFHTVRFLKPSQVFWRIYYRFHRPRVPAAPCPERREAAGSWARVIEKKPFFVPPDRFTFLNRTEQPGPEWRDPGNEKLWTYHLHYFDDLNAAGAGTRRSDHNRLMDQWIRENPAGTGDGWEPYPVSLRVVNWIKWALAGNRLSQHQCDSLCLQVTWLMQKLEYHLLGNHLLANAKALVFAGLFFTGAGADRWRAKGLAILARQLDEQILSDGGHFERSPMYHAILLEDLLDLIQCSRLFPGIVPERRIRTWQGAAVNMLDALGACCHPDGGIAFFNDAAFGNAPELAALQAYARHLGMDGRLPETRIQVLGESGYAAVRRGPAVLIVDAAPVGPDYLPGHAHADTLSFELSLDRRRILVNSGTSCYGDGPERLRQRKTPAHNTLTVDGMDSSEVWGGFRVARRARIRHFKVETRDDRDIITGCHDGYTRIAGDHHRKWTLRDGQLEIRDRLGGTGSHAVCLHFHLHPAVGLEISDGKWILTDETGKDIAWIQPDPALDVAAESSTFHPEFGKSIPNRKITMGQTVRLPFESMTRIHFT